MVTKNCETKYSFPIIVNIIENNNTIIKLCQRISQSTFNFIDFVCYNLQQMRLALKFLFLHASLSLFPGHFATLSSKSALLDFQVYKAQGPRSKFDICGRTVSDSILRGNKTHFLTTLYNSKNIGGDARAPAPPPLAPQSLKHFVVNFQDIKIS